MARPASIAIAQNLGVSTIDAQRSPAHAAAATAEAQAHGEVVERLLTLLGLSPEQVLAATARASATVDA